MAEDNTTNQQVGKAILAKLGYEVDIVDDGEQALRALEGTRYDLVLMDCQMPVMDGYEATSRIRQSQSLEIDPRIPVIALTAHAMDGDREKCLAAGMDDYLVKPIQPRELGAMVEAWLARRGPSF
jgi:CheY-like chemotaxis protein